MRPLILFAFFLSLCSDRVKAQGYCHPSYETAGAFSDFIRSFAMGGIDNQNSGPSEPTGYSDYTYSGADRITSVVPGGVYTASVTTGSPDVTDSCFIWLDVDHDFTYEPEELLVRSGFWPGDSTVDVDFVIPEDTPNGYTGMRVMLAADGDPPEPCGAFERGETEDYTLVIDDGSSCLPVFGVQASTGYYVSGVTVEDLQWTSPIAPYWGYTDHLAVGAHLRAGETSQMTITAGSASGPQLIQVWVDWDYGNFTASELVGGGIAYSPFSDIMVDITPPGEFPGIPVMYAILRVASCDTGFVDPCTDGWDNGGSAVDLTIAVGHDGWPCLPLQGHGTEGGHLFGSFTLQGTPYSTSHSYPYYSTGLQGFQHFHPGALVHTIIASGGYAPENYTLSMDIDHNGELTGPEENLGSVQSVGPNEYLPLDVTIPATCPLGQYVLRLRSNDAANDSIPDQCSNSTHGETLDLVVVVEDPDGPCIPTTYVGTLNGDFIDGVRLGAIQNMGSGAVSGPAYHDHPGLSTDLLVGSVDTLFVTGGEQPEDDYTAWVDHNNDEVLWDEGECIGTVHISSSYAEGSIIFTVPPDTPLGYKRLRVRGAALQYDVCNNYLVYGEMEDYRVNIVSSTGVGMYPTYGLSVRTAEDGARLVCGDEWIGAEYTLIDAAGHLVASGRLTPERAISQNLALTKGIYAVRITSDERRALVRFAW